MLQRSVRNSWLRLREIVEEDIQVRSRSLDFVARGFEASMGEEGRRQVG